MIAVSKEKYDELKNLNIPINKIELIENGIIVPKIEDTTKSAQYKKELGLEIDCLLSGAVGRMSVEKGHIYFLEAVKELVNQYNSIIASDIAPDIEPSKHCGECEFWDHCTKEKSPNWIIKLPRLSESKWQEITRIGVEEIQDIPNEFQLTSTQNRVKECLISGSDYIDPALGQAINELSYPIHFLDFETINPAIPLYAGTSKE